VSNERIRSAIKGIAQNDFKEDYGIVCIVVSVDVPTLTCECEPITGDSNLLDVRLQTEAGNGVIMIPTEGSKVIVQPINDMTGYVSMYSSLDSIQLLDGTYGGLIKISDIVGKLNNLENDINDLKTVFGSWVVVPSDGGAALKTITTTWATSALTPTVEADIENDKITHGNT